MALTSISSASSSCCSRSFLTARLPLFNFGMRASLQGHLDNGCQVNNFNNFFMDLFIAFFLIAASAWLLLDFFRAAGHERDEEREK